MGTFSDSLWNPDTEYYEKPLTPKEFRIKMETLSKSIDKERVHVEMDRAMCELLESLGYSAGIEYFNSVEKWYA